MFHGEKVSKCGLTEEKKKSIRHMMQTGTTRVVLEDLLFLLEVVGYDIASLMMGGNDMN